MTVDERVRDAMHAYADPIEPAPGSWARIESRLDDPLSPVRKPRGPFVLAGVAMALIVVLIGTVVARSVDGEGNVSTDGVIGDPGTPVVAVLGSDRIVRLDASMRQVGDELFAHAGITEVTPAVDGRAVYVVTNDPGPCRGGPEAFRVPLDGGEAVKVSTGMSSLRELRHDGRTLMAFTGAIDCSDAGRVIRYRDVGGIDTDQPPEVQLPRDAIAVEILDASADGGALLLRVPRPGGLALYRVDVASGSLTELPGTDLVAGSFMNDERSAFLYTARLDELGTRIDLATLDGGIVSGGPILPTGVDTIDAGPGSGQQGLGVTQDSRLFTWSGIEWRFVDLPESVSAATWVPDPPAPEPPAPLPPARILVIDKTDRGATSMTVLPSGSQGGSGEMGAADGIVPGSPVAVTPDGREMFAVRRSPAATCGDGSSIWRQAIAGGVRDGQEILNATSPALSPDGRYLAFVSCAEGTASSSLSLRDLTTNMTTATIIEGWSYGQGRVQFSSDGTRVLAGLEEGSSPPFGAYEFDVVDGRLEGGRSISSPSSVEVSGYWGGADSVVAIDNRTAPQQVVVVSASSGAIKRTLFEARDLPGGITNVVPDRSGTAVLVMVDDQALYRWTDGDGALTKVHNSFVTATWMPDAPAPPEPDPSATPGATPAVPESAVPRPITEGSAEAVALRDPPRERNAFGYRFDPQEAERVAVEYRDLLAAAGYEIRDFRSTGGSGGPTVRYRAVGHGWDVSVVAAPGREQGLGMVIRLHADGA